jgi:hypothetical protein
VRHLPHAGPQPNRQLILTSLPRTTPHSYSHLPLLSITSRYQPVTSLQLHLRISTKEISQPLDRYHAASNEGTTRAAKRTNPINSTKRIQTRRAIDHATWEFPSTGRQLTAKDLIQEWDDTAHQNWSSELGADQHIKELTQRFLKEDPVHSYSQDVFRRYYSIYRVTTKEEVHHHGAEETRPCLRTWSKVHKLNCGHTVFTEKETCCAGNCDSIYGNCGGPQYFCQLCARNDLRVPDSALPDRWYDLLLTRRGKPGQAARKSAQPGMLEAQPAYLDQHGYVILPRIHCTIAMVRASDIRKEEDIKTLIATICPIDNGNLSFRFLHLDTWMLLRCFPFQFLTQEVGLASAIEDP